MEIQKLLVLIALFSNNLTDKAEGNLRLSGQTSTDGLEDVYKYKTMPENLQNQEYSRGVKTGVKNAKALHQNDNFVADGVFPAPKIHIATFAESVNSFHAKIARLAPTPRSKVIISLIVVISLFCTVVLLWLPLRSLFRQFGHLSLGWNKFRRGGTAINPIVNSDSDISEDNPTMTISSLSFNTSDPPGSDVSLSAISITMPSSRRITNTVEDSRFVADDPPSYDSLYPRGFGPKPCATFERRAKRAPRRSTSEPPLINMDTPDLYLQNYDGIVVSIS